MSKFNVSISFTTEVEAESEQDAMMILLDEPIGRHVGVQNFVCKEVQE